MALMALLEYYAKAFFKSKTAIIGYGLGPISYIFLISIVSKGKMLPIAIIGGIVTFAIDRGLADIPIELSGMRARSKFYDIFLSLPLSPLSFAIGLSIGMSLPSLPYLLSLIITLTVIKQLDFLKFSMLIMVIISIWTWSSLTGLYMGLKIKEPTTAIRLSTITITALTIIPPVYYPIETLPKSICMPLLLIPTASATYVIRSLYTPLPYRNIAVIILALYLLISLILGVRVMKLKEE